MSSLLTRLRAGGAVADTAFDELLLAVRKPLIALLCRRGATRELAEDLMHDSLMQVLDKLDQFREESALSTWLFTIAKNRLIDHQRREKHQVDLQPTAPAEEEGEELDLLTDAMDAWKTEPSAEDAAQLRALQRCLELNLPIFRERHPARADELDLILDMGWSAKQLADFLGEADTTTRKRMQRHRDILRVILDPCADHYGGRVL